MPLPTLIETIRIRAGTAPLWRLHLHRLSTSCAGLGVSRPGDLVAPTGGPDRVHRVEVSATGVSLTVREVGPSDPIRLVTSPVPHRPYPHKITDRGIFDHSLIWARAAGADDGVLLTTDGCVAEASIWGVFWWEMDRLCAPSLELGVLPGVARARLAEITGGIAERRVRRADLAAVPMFVANAARGIVEVTKWDENAVPSHLGTRRLREVFWA